MIEESFKQFLNGSIALCGVAGLFSLTRWKRFGRGALYLTLAFVVMAALLWALVQALPMVVIVVLSVVLCGLLAGDMLMRSAPRE